VQASCCRLIGLCLSAPLPDHTNALGPFGRDRHAARSNDIFVELDGISMRPRRFDD
jgi:hypothetical protein